MDTIRRFGPVWFVPGRKQGHYPYCHSIYIQGAGVLIDPASDQEILRQLRDGPGVKEIWLSHWHEDHLTHLNLFEDVPFKMALEDAPPLSDLETFLDWYEMDEPVSRAMWRERMVRRFNFRPRRPSGDLPAGAVIDLGTVQVEVLATPGHTPGHRSFFFRGPEALFLGDYDLTSFGPYYGELNADIQGVIDSVNRLSRMPAKTWLASHGTGVFIENPGSRWQRFLDVIDQREKKLIQFLEQPRTRRDVIDAWIVYKKPRPPLEFYSLAEWVIMKKHLERLMRQGRVKQDQGRYWLA